jgi:hypothetical protein
MSALMMAAMSAHEMFTSLVKAGFTESQALYLTGRVIAASQSSGDTP